jgi:hypothetical protein
MSDCNFLRQLKGAPGDYGNDGAQGLQGEMGEMLVKNPQTHSKLLNFHILLAWTDQKAWLVIWDSWEQSDYLD